MKNKIKKANNLTNALDNRIKHKIRQDLLTQAYTQSLLGYLPSLACATIVFIAFYPLIEVHRFIFIWYIGFLLISLLRIVITKLYIEHTGENKNLFVWQSIFIISVILGGGAWGVASLLLTPEIQFAQHVLLVLILAGITAGASTLLAGELISAIAFLSAALLPIILQLGYYGNNLLFNITATAYWVYLISLSFKLHDTLKTSLSLRYQNDTLVEDLRLAKAQLEAINKKLSKATNVSF